MRVRGSLPRLCAAPECAERVCARARSCVRVCSRPSCPQHRAAGVCGSRNGRGSPSLALSAPPSPAGEGTGHWSVRRWIVPQRPPVLALPRGCAKQCAGAGRSAGGVRRCSGGDGGAVLPEVWGAVGRSEEDCLPRCEVTRRSERACGRHASHARVVAARAGAPAPALSRGRSLAGPKGGECEAVVGSRG